MAKAKKIIAVDVDEVLAAEKEAVRLFINEKFGTNHTPEDYSIEAHYWGYWESVWRVSDEEAHQRFTAYLNSGSHGSHQIVEGAVEAILTLQKEYDLTVITSRNDQLFDITHQWLETNFPKVFKRVEFVTLWSKDKKVSKAVICNNIGASYLIDDNLEHCALVAEVGVKGLLFGEYGWNKGKVLPTGVVRVKDWQAVLEYFDGQRK